MVVWICVCLFYFKVVAGGLLICAGVVLGLIYCWLDVFGFVLFTGACTSSCLIVL